MMRAYALPVRDHFGRGMHEGEQMRGEGVSRDAEQDGEHDSAADSLYGGDGRALGIVLADAAGDRRGGGHGEPHGDREDEHDDGFGEPDGGHRVGAEPGHPEGVDHAERGFHHHFEDGRDGEQSDAAGEAALGKILCGAGQGLAQELPFALRLWLGMQSRLHKYLAEESSPSLTGLRIFCASGK